ncbi:oligosaccharide flippase family protein [Butyrivibrio sp. MB2005]|uniref:oligosaccharide flippase family protein n=1 Tax=Butyrivibrio sp. MB2005 TaxID=1280678 RepID=UPI0004045A38|nr:oligosaccharide flippase family protein [Butyrivibrio sp. MB2005]
MANERIKSNFIYNALFQLSGIVVPLITLPYLTRVLHADGMGKYAFSYSVAYYFYIFIRLGLHNYGNRTIAYVKDDQYELSKTFFEIYAFQFVMGCSMSVIYLMYCIFLSTNKTLSFIFMLIVLAGGIDLTWALYGLEEFKVTSIRDISVKVLTAACIFAFVKDEADVWKYSLIYCSGFFISQLVSIPVLKKRIHYVKPGYQDIIIHIKPNLVLFLPTIAVSVYKTMDKIMLGLMSSDLELGYYHSCENIIKIPLALITALGTVMLPRMSNILSHGDDNPEAESIFDKSILFAMFISSSVCIGIMTVSKEFVPLFFGEGFEKCITLFNIVLPSCLFLAFANVIRTQFLLPRKKDKLFVISLFTGAAVNLILNLILIPGFASVGAAIGTLAAEIVVCVVQAVSVYKEAHIGRNIINSLPFVLAGVLMYAVFSNYSPVILGNDILSLLFKIVICGLFYLAVLGVLWFGKIKIHYQGNNSVKKEKI